MATAQQFDAAEIGWEAAWLKREDDEFDRLADAANDEAEAEKSQPIYRTPAFPDSLLDAAEAEAQAYQERTDKAVARSTVYRLLERHGWRKIVPRPRHPKADVAAQAAFKKTAPRGTPRGLAPG